VSDYDSRVYIYALADPADFVREIDPITRFFCAALQTQPGPTNRIALQPDSGWFAFTATDQLWDRTAPPYLLDAPAAKAAAEAMLRAVEKACSDANPAWPTTLKGRALLPPTATMKAVSLDLVARPDGRGFDHWLYRAEPQLVLDGARRRTAGVFGAEIEVRIGHMGRIIALRSRWTPLSGEKILAPLSPFVAAEDQHGAGEEHAHREGDQHDHVAGDDVPLINYVLDGDGVPQFYLAPYYFANHAGHHFGISSASPYSLTVEFAQIEQTRRNLKLVARASGGSGDYLYNWATYSLLAMETGVREIGSGERVRIDTGEGKADVSVIVLDNTPCVVLVNVKDSRTGAFKHRQHQVFPSPWLAEADEAQSVPMTA
jgi:hypothetical protein